MSTNITAFEGRLADDVEYRETPQGYSVATGVVLVNQRRRGEDGEWTDAEPARRYLEAWRGKARRLASLGKGDAVIVIGSVRTETWNHRETGQKMTRDIVEVDAIGQGITLTTTPGEPAPAPHERA